MKRYKIRADPQPSSGQGDRPGHFSPHPEIPVGPGVDQAGRRQQGQALRGLFRILRQSDCAALTIHSNDCRFRSSRLNGDCMMRVFQQLAGLQSFAVITAVYVICHGLTAWVVTPVQGLFLPEVTVFASPGLPAARGAGASGLAVRLAGCSAAGRRRLPVGADVHRCGCAPADGTGAAGVHCGWRGPRPLLPSRLPGC